MRHDVAAAIEELKSIINNTYIVPEHLKNDVERIFKGMDEIGENSTDANDFQMKFAPSAIGQEFYGLFSKLQVKTVTAGDYLKENVKQSFTTKEGREQMLQGAAERAEYEATIAARHELYEAGRDTLRDIPVVGDIMHGKQLYDMGKSISGLFGRKKK